MDHKGKIDTPITLPGMGESPESILDRLDSFRQRDVDWENGRIWSLVYRRDDAHDQLLKDAHTRFFSANYLNPMAFPSLHRLEREIVGMTADLLHGGPETVGVVSSGGTESILLAMLAYRERARKDHPRIRRPEVVAPATIHPAFEKGAHLFGLTLRKARVHAGQEADVDAMARLINPNTVLLAASAPSYSSGALDPIREIGDLARNRNLPFHVDACIGGFILPWVKGLPDWDFRVEGVTSMSADLHKFGFGAKGASTLLYRGMEFLQHQFFISTDFPGGIYASPTLMGTRPGGPIAAAWAGLHHLGDEGYRENARILLEATEKLRTGLEALPSIEIVGKPCMNILAWKTRNNRPDVFVLADYLETMGWLVDRQQYPASIHMTVLLSNAHAIDQYLKDIRQALQQAGEHSKGKSEGTAAMYGLMARLPMRGMVEDNVRKLLMDMHSRRNGTDISMPAPKPWMTGLNRLLAWLKG